MENQNSPTQRTPKAKITVYLCPTTKREIRFVSFLETITSTSRTSLSAIVESCIKQTLPSYAECLLENRGKELSPEQRTELKKIATDKEETEQP